MPVPAKPRTCPVCKRTLSADYFHRYSAYTRSTRCNACRKARPHGPKGMCKAPHPCKVCGKEIWRDEAPSRLAARKTCSIACENASRRTENRMCIRCKRVLPYRMFGKALRGRGVKASCLECLSDEVKDVHGGLVLRPQLHSFRITLKQAAQRRGVPYELSPEQSQELHASACTLCGKAVSSLILKNAERGYRMGNVRAVCRVCKRLTRILPYSEILLLSHEIALHNPLVKKKGGK